MAKVSVIVPIYGVEKYIERCVRSLLMQTLDDMEFIFVNDCTNDDSISILNKVVEEYPKRKAQIKIVNHEINKGLPVARQTGLKLASGDFIAHCDSDDWVDCMMYEKMYESALLNNADVVVCDYYVSDGTTEEKRIGFYNKTQMDLLGQMLSKRVPSTVWNKIVKRNLYEKAPLVFPKYNMGEDIALMSQLLIRSINLSHVEEPLYYYFINPNSICNENKDNEDSTLKKYNQAQDNLSIVKEVLSKENSSKNYEKALECYYFYESKLIYPLIGKEDNYYQMWSEAIKGLKWKIIFNPYIKGKYKLMYLLSYFKLYLPS